MPLKNLLTSFPAAKLLMHRQVYFCIRITSYFMLIKRVNLIKIRLFLLALILYTRKGQIIRGSRKDLILIRLVESYYNIMFLKCHEDFFQHCSGYIYFIFAHFSFSFHIVQLDRCDLGSHIGLERCRRHTENPPSEKGESANQSSISLTI